MNIIFYSRKQSLFSKYPLDGYLRQAKSSMDQEIKNLSYQKINEHGEENLVKTLLEKYRIVIPTLSEDEIKVDAKEQEITVDNRNSRFLHDGPIKRMGLVITVSIPFEGIDDLFQCRPSTYSLSGTPGADVKDNSLVLYYETTEKDSEKIKALWKNDIKEIKQNLEWIKNDISNYNNSLEADINKVLINRKKEAGESEDLISKITT